MIKNYYKKISKELLFSVDLKSAGDKEYDCIVYTNNYNKLKDVVNGEGKKKLFEYPFINALGLKLNEDEIFFLAKNNCVSYISKQTRVSAQIDVSKKIMKADNIFDLNKKSNFSIAIIDTGISPLIDFVLPKNRIIKFVDLINNKHKPYDDNGHGTFVTSIACGSGLLSNKKYSGISPLSNIVSIKALDDKGETGAYKILEAMQWVYDNHKKYNIKVVCMSFGSNPADKTDPLVVGAEVLWNNGIAVVAAAGNSGPEQSTIKSPGISKKIITVGGLNDFRDEKGEYDEKKFQVAKFSSRGPVENRYFKPDLVAPAVNIVGADLYGSYSKMSGTSVATPMIAGICMLIYANNPTISTDQLKLRLIRSCKKISYSQNDDGFGLINVKKIFLNK